MGTNTITDVAFLTFETGGKAGAVLDSSRATGHFCPQISQTLVVDLGWTGITQIDYSLAAILASLCH